MAHRCQHKRDGFTLLEVLTVIGLMALLAALIIVTLPRIGNTANEAATRATMTKVSELLNKRLDAITRELSDQDERAGNGLPDYVNDAANTGALGPVDPVDPQQRELAKVLGRKAFLRRHLPQFYSDLGPPPPATPEASPFFYALANLTPGSSDPVTWTPSTGDTTVTAELLYHMLTHGEAFGVEVLEEWAFSASEIADTENEDFNGNGTLDAGEDVNDNGVLDVNGDGLMELVDSWGNPLRFYRWPTRVIRPALGANTPTTDQGIDTSDDPMFPDNPQLWKYTLRIDPAFGGAVNATARVLITSIDLAPTGVTRGPGAQFQHETGINDSVNPFIEGDPLARDPDDPVGRLHDKIVAEMAGGTTEFLDFFDEAYHDPDTWHSPLIVSVGTDGFLGLFEPVDKTNHGHLAQPDFSDDGEALLDNITNKQR